MPSQADGRALPGEPGRALPGEPGRALPGEPGRALPGEPGRALPGEPGRALPGDDYDLLPYPSMPVALSQPQHLAALAALFGIEAPDVERARVLELGCAAGGNIIPLAVRFPAASFCGIDLARRHINEGRRRIAALALTNVRLEQGDLAYLDLAGQQFDYVICHGVYSWVPKAVQDGILRICRDCLAPNGVATISYNVLPGWHLRMVIRDLCRHYAGTDGTPQRRVARARAALARIAAAADETEQYGLVLRTEARRLRDVPSAYILGEFLARDNAPCHVRDFIGQAANAELDYLCELDLFAAVPPKLDPTLRARITSVAGTDRPAAEQLIDFLTGRLFRRSVLVRHRPDFHPSPMPDADRLHGLHVAGPLRLDRTQSDDGHAVFTAQDQPSRSVSTTDPIVRDAFARLGEAYPGTVAAADLVGGSGGGTDGPETTTARLRQALLTIVMAGRASVSVLPLRVGSAAAERPTAWSFARMEATASQPWITTLRHTGIPAQPILKLLLPLLDGAHDRAALQERLAAALGDGTLKVPELPADPWPPSAAKLAETAALYLGRSLEYLARNAVLEPGPRPADRPAEHS